LSQKNKKITYFDRPGEQNTDETLKLAKIRAEELDIRDIVVASTTGETGIKVSEAFCGFNVVVVSHMTGFKEPEEQQMPEENRRKIEANGAKVLTAMHTFSGVERAIRNKFATAYPAEIMAQTLRIFGEGTKAAIEVVVMAADAGLIPVSRDVIAMAGTGKGVDTALVLRPKNSTQIFDLSVKEIIAKPATR
jgi:hypothetical protein